MASTETTQLDAVLGVIEDIVLSAGAGLGTWLTTKNMDDTITAVAATHGAKSVIALAMTGARTGKLVKAIKLITSVLGELNAPTVPAHSL